MRLRTLALVVTACLVAPACSDDDGSESAATTPTTVTVPAAPTTTVDTEAMMDDVRESLVRLVMERDGLDRAAAEARADELMAKGADNGAVEKQMTLYSSWMSNYRMHPVLGRHWSEEEAECVVVTMMQVEGMGRTAALMSAAQTGGMEVDDALALVQPVGFCVDLRAMMHADMTALGVPQDPDCLLAGLTEEDVASWFVALFTHGREGFNAAMGEDLDLTCPTGS